MTIRFKIPFSIILKIIIFTIIDKSSQEKPLLLVICYDGFRTDYLYRGITPILINFKLNGVSTKYLKTVYPPLAIPSLHSIATGLYPQNHGYRMRNHTSPDGSKTRVVTDPEAFTQNETVPIWVLNQKNGGVSACIMWPGTETTYNGITCKYIMKYNRTTSLKSRVDTMMGYLEDDKNINLVMFYVEELDRITHFFGILSRNSSMMIKRIDLLTKYILSQLIRKNFYSRTNIVILSDHGMQSVGKEKEVGEFWAYFMPMDFNFTDEADDVNGIYHIKIEQTYMLEYEDAVNKLFDYGESTGRFTVVRVPPGINGTIAQIEYAACPNYILDLTKWKFLSFLEKHVSYYKDKYKLNWPAPEEDRWYAAHGYLRENDAMFMAKGPQLAMFKQVEPFEMVDLYSLFTRLLNIKGNFDMDGNSSRVHSLFVTHNPVNWPGLLTTIVALAVITSCVFFVAVGYIKKIRTWDSYSY